MSRTRQPRTPCNCIATVSSRWAQVSYMTATLAARVPIGLRHSSGMRRRRLHASESLCVLMHMSTRAVGKISGSFIYECYCLRIVHGTLREGPAGVSISSVCARECCGVSPAAVPAARVRDPRRCVATCFSSAVGGALISLQYCSRCMCGRQVHLRGSRQLQRAARTRVVAGAIIISYDHMILYVAPYYRAYIYVNWFFSSRCPPR